MHEGPNVTTRMEDARVILAVNAIVVKYLMHEDFAGVANLSIFSVVTQVPNLRMDHQIQQL